MCSRKKKPYHNVARQSPLIFSIFLHQVVQESSVDLWDNLNKVRGLPHNALHFPSFFYYYYLGIPQQRESFSLIEGVSTDRYKSVESRLLCMWDGAI